MKTRRERWRVAPEAASVAFGLSADDRAIYVPYLSGHLVALDAADGRERWRAGGPAAGYIWTPLIYDARLLVAGSGAGFVAFLR
jgi:outer membrane protein assembly factor BamB